MEKAIIKATTLIEALGYIQRFSDKIIVIKMGGSIMDSEQALTDLLTDVVFLNTVGMRPVIVHGGGKAISEAMEKRGLEVQFVQSVVRQGELCLRLLRVLELLLLQVERRAVEDILLEAGVKGSRLDYRPRRLAASSHRTPPSTSRVRSRRRRRLRRSVRGGSLPSPCLA